MAIAGHDLKITGVDELKKDLKRMGDKLTKKHTRAALTKAAVVIRREMKARAPVRTGKLKGAIGYSIKKVRGTEGQWFARVGVRSKKGAHYAWFVEEGTHSGSEIKPHPKRGKKAIKFSNLVRRRAKMRGQSARPFLEPAFNAKRNEALNAMITELRRRIVADAKA